MAAEKSDKVSIAITFSDFILFILSGCTARIPSFALSVSLFLLYIK